MAAARSVLIILMAGILLLMATCPGLYDSHRSFVAHKHHFTNPSPETLRELAAAKKLDRRDIRIYETIMGTLLVICGVAFTRAGKLIQKNRVTGGANDEERGHATVPIKRD